MERETQDMKSYYNHLITTQSFGNPVDHNRKPVFRASTIFPVINNEHFTSRISFLGYWLLKRQISEVGLLITLRNRDGNILKRNNLAVNLAKAYSLELRSLLQGIESYDKSSMFLGSVELEVFSARDLVFAYPAFILNYYNEEFSTSVHSVGRVYNDFEDLAENEDTKVPESGFDIYSGKDFEPFIAFTNGPLINDNAIIDYTVVNHESQKFIGTISLGKINPYETLFLRFDEHIRDLDRMLNGKVGTIKISHNFKGFFPRFLAGNLQHSFPSASFTHTYYDCSSCSSDSDYWNRRNESYNDSAVLIPLFTENDFYTELVFYPNFSPSVFSLSFDLYDPDGNLIKKVSDFAEINSKEQKFFKINFNEVINEHKLDSNVKAVNIIANWKNGKVPTRLKLGLNVGISGKKSKLPCNICFAPKIGDPLVDGKSGSFHWSPLLNREQSVVTITNGTPLKKYKREAKVSLSFFHEKDNEFIERIIRIKPFGHHKVDLATDQQLKRFFENGIGWMTSKSDNPHVGGWYFEFHKSGSVAGDHFF